MTTPIRRVPIHLGPPAGPSATAPRILDEARRLLIARPDIRYVLGGGHGLIPGPTFTSGGWGLDCSGFTRWACAQALGVDVLGNTASRDQRRLLPKVDHAHAAAGDLVFFFHFRVDLDRLEWGHVGVFTGADDVIHCADAPICDGLRLDRLSSIDALSFEFHRLTIPREEPPCAP